MTVILQREIENYTDPFAVAVMKLDDSAKTCVLYMCTFVPETFIKINFHEIVLAHEKVKISTPRKKPAIR